MSSSLPQTWVIKPLFLRLLRSHPLDPLILQLHTPHQPPCSNFRKKCQTGLYCLTVVYKSSTADYHLFSGKRDFAVPKLRLTWSTFLLGCLKLRQQRRHCSRSLLWEGALKEPPPMEPSKRKSSKLWLSFRLAAPLCWLVGDDDSNQKLAFLYSMWMPYTVFVTHW